MNSSVCRNGTSFVESLFEKFGKCHLRDNAFKYVSLKFFEEDSSLNISADRHLSLKLPRSLFKANHHKITTENITQTSSKIEHQTT